MSQVTTGVEKNVESVPSGETVTVSADSVAESEDKTVEVVATKEEEADASPAPLVKEDSTFSVASTSSVHITGATGNESTDGDGDTEAASSPMLIMSDASAAVGEEKQKEEFKEKCEKPLPVVFIDMPDPDNFVCVLATYSLLVKDEFGDSEKLHVVISGRPTNLAAKSLTPKEFGSRLKAGEKIGDLLKRGKSETDNKNHSTRVLEDGAVCLSLFLQRHGISPSKFCIYNGGIAPNAPVSHRMHAREFLFDRADLVDPSRKQGSIINSTEYYELVKKFDDMSEDGEREEAVLKVLRRAEGKNIFRPLSELVENIGKRPLMFILGGPATGIQNLLGLPAVDSSFVRQISSLHGMYGAWDNAKPGSFNLFPNQFNVAADIEAACDLLIRKRPQFPMYFVPTETCKHKQLSMTPEKLDALIREYYQTSGGGSILKMYQLWFNIQGRRPFFIFDMAPVLSASEKYRKIYTMLDVEASYDSEGVLRIRSKATKGEEGSEEESKGGQPILMASKDLSNEAIESYYTALGEVFAAAKLHVSKEISEEEGRDEGATKVEGGAA